MAQWPDRRVIDLVGIEHPIIQAPMAGWVSPEMVIAVSEVGGLGSLPTATSTTNQMRAEFGIIRQRTTRPVNLNFFCHSPPRIDARRMAAWEQRLAPYYAEFGLDAKAAQTNGGRASFNEEMCDLVTELRPAVVSFHFGLPEKFLLDRVRSTGAKILSSATTVEEARRLEGEGCDAIIAQGFEAGGHRGIFLGGDVATQVGTMALTPQVVDAVRVPVIAAGGIADARGIVAALALGASAVQIGTAYLFCPESRASAIHREALAKARDDRTVLTNVFTGRPARGLVNRLIREVGPMSDLAPDFPLAYGAVAPLRQKAEAEGSSDFTPLLAGQAAALGREMPAGELTKRFASEALAKLGAR